MKLKTSELAGAALDWAVAAALNAQFGEDRVIKVCRHEATTPAWIERENSPGSVPYYHRFSPSTDWVQGGAILDREGITVIRADDDYEVDAKGFTTNKRIPQWFAECSRWTGHSLSTSYEGEHMAPTFMVGESGGYYGPTPLIAAMRSYVASKLGDEVEVPEGLA